MLDLDLRIKVIKTQTNRTNIMKSCQRISQKKKKKHSTVGWTTSDFYCDSENADVAWVK